MKRVLELTGKGFFTENNFGLFDRALFNTRLATLVFVLLGIQVDFPYIRVSRWNATGLVVVALFCTLIFHFFPHSNRKTQLEFVYGIDAFLIIILVYLTDDIQSPFFPLFYVNGLLLSTAFGTRFGLFYAFFVSGLITSLEYLEPRPTNDYFWQIIFFVLPFFF